MNKKYTFFIVFLAIGVCIEPILSAELSRQKRDLGTVISIIAEVGPPVYSIIRGALKKKKCGKKIDPNMVNGHYNNNMGHSQELKNVVSSRMAEAGNAIHMKSSGYYCDATYCAEMGPNAKGTLGICARHYCVCENGIGYVRDCGHGQVYEPMSNICTSTKKAILCH